MVKPDACDVLTSEHTWSDCSGPPCRRHYPYTLDPCERSDEECVAACPDCNGCMHNNGGCGSDECCVNYNYCTDCGYRE